MSRLASKNRYEEGGECARRTKQSWHAPVHCRIRMASRDISTSITLYMYLTQEYEKKTRPVLNGMQRQGHAVVLVLGDVGRSPRMQYHALSLAKENPTIQVSLVGYRGEQCIPAVKNNPRIQLCYVDPFASEALR